MNDLAAVSCSPTGAMLGGVGLGFWWQASLAVHSSVHGWCIAWCIGAWWLDCWGCPSISL